MKIISTKSVNSIEGLNTPEEIEQRLICWLNVGQGRHLYNVSAPQKHITSLWREHIRRRIIGGIEWDNSVVWDYINRMTEKFGDTYKKRIITIKGKIINKDEFDIDMERLLFENTDLIASCFKLKVVEEKVPKKVILKKKLLILEEEDEVVVEDKVVVKPTVVYGDKIVIIKKKKLLILEN